MITADTLKTLTTFTAGALTRAIRDAGYKKDQFLRAVFIGITNGGQYCYSVEYEGLDGIEQGKVFLTYDPIAGAVKADY